MSYFTQARPGSTLYRGQSGAGVGYVAAVFPGATPPEQTCSIADVLGTTEAGATLNASIVFLQQPIADDAGDEAAFIQAVAALLAAQKLTRLMAWSVSPTDFTSAEIAGLSGAGGSVFMSTSLTLYDANSQLRITIPRQQPMQATDTALTLTWNTPPIFNGIDATPYANPPLTIPFTGPNAFCLQMLISMTQLALDVRNLGFAYATAPPPPADPNVTETMLYAPLMTPDLHQTPLFQASFDPLDLFNAVNPDRTVLVFQGNNLEATATTFQSCYRSPSGAPVTFTPVTTGNPAQPGGQPPYRPAGVAPLLAGDQPARLVFNQQQFRNNTPAIFMLVPEGDFGMTAAPGAPATMLCGLRGTEYFTFTSATTTTAGDRVRFITGSPAYAPLFPFPPASPTAAPFDPLASPLTQTWTTSFALVRPAAGSTAATPMAIAQPAGFELFGQTAAVTPAHPNLLGAVSPGAQLIAAPSHPFPMVPYQRVSSAGSPTLMDGDQIAAFEAGVLSPLRSAAVAADSQPFVGTKTATLVTPGGYLITTQTNAQAAGQPFTTAKWTQILLGEVGSDPIAFNNPDAALVNAFSTGSLMLVIANASNLQDFSNTLTIGDWTMEANVARPNAYGDYANIVIVKGMPGALQDLVINPSNWTDPGTFAAPLTDPTSGAKPDPGQLVNVAAWLQDYFAEAAAVTGPDAQYFASFNAIAADPNWMGVLILRADITQIPDSIAGIVAGITDFSHFNVHHLAIPIVPATASLAVQQSPVSGLIYYNPYPGNPPAQAVSTDPALTYGFQLNSLKVTFQNSAVQTFSSYAQITLRNVLGSAVTSSDAGFDAVVLTGTYQLLDGHPVYSMASTTETTLFLDCAVLPYVDVTGVQMATIQAVAGGNTVSAFSIVGYMDFAILPGAVTNPDGVVDLFSFGRAQSTDQAAGLTFQNMVLTMTYPTPPPGPVAPVAATFSLASDALRFDLGTSTIRPGSLVGALSLQASRFVQSPETTTPASLGYLPVIAMVPAGSLGDPWNAIAFDLDMGTPGQLAAKAGLTASMLLAWNPTSNDPATWDVQIGLQLPGTSQGASLISIQTVLNLSIGQVSLLYAQTADQKSNSYLLMLNEIALSFLGLLKFPPNGATSFYLFGDPNGGGGQQTSLGWYALYTNTGESA